MNKATTLFLLPLIAPLIAVAACAPEQEETDLTVATTDGEVEAIAAGLPALAFADLQLGAKIVGPRGPQVEASLTNEAGAFADITCYVACPAGMDPCDPKTAPEGTIYTYVHIVYPGEDNKASTGSGKGTNSSHVERAEAFRMTKPAHGFTGKVGYSKLEALSASGDSVDVVITCVDGGLAWTVNSGDGGNQWEQAEPITFFWQSTLPPAGPADAYAIEANTVLATGAGPYPAANEKATNACTGSSTAK